MREILTSDSASPDTVSEATGVSLLHLVSGVSKETKLCVYACASMWGAIITNIHVGVCLHGLLIDGLFWGKEEMLFSLSSLVLRVYILFIAM